MHGHALSKIDRSAASNLILVSKKEGKERGRKDGKHVPLQRRRTTLVFRRRGVHSFLVRSRCQGTANDAAAFASAQANNKAEHNYRTGCRAQVPACIVYMLSQLNNLPPPSPPQPPAALRTHPITMPSFASSSLSSYRRLHTLAVPGMQFQDLVVKVLETPQPSSSSSSSSSSSFSFLRVLVG